MYIPQRQLVALSKLVTSGKVVIIYGARQVGKTTLIRKFLETKPFKSIVVAGDDIMAREYLESQSIEKLKAFISSHELLIIDEAQYIRNIGINLKLLVDHVPGLRIIATGSSSFDLARQTGEPLTGRKFTLRLFPLAQAELAAVEDRRETDANLEFRLIYGSYPEVVTTMDNAGRERYLQEMVSAYLFKDILQLEGIRHADKLLRLLQLLAFQIGHEVSVAELGGQLGMSKNTIDRYLDLLEKVFVIYRRSGFSRNLRKEITKSSRFYFLDNGIRNALIRNFNPPALRDDIGALWENYIMTERMKFLEYTGLAAASWFWRTYNQQEIDLIEERAGRLHGYEIKWGAGKTKPPRQWTVYYPDSEFRVITPANYLEFIGAVETSAQK